MNSRINQMLVCDHNRIAGLCVDGKVYFHNGYDDKTYPEEELIADNDGSKLITKVAFGGLTSIVLDAAGNLKATGDDEYGQVSPVSGWKGPFSDVVCNMRHTVALRSNGTVVACGWNEFGQCNVSGWTNIAAVSVGLMHTVGLKNDGTVVACGINADSECDVSSDKWRDIIAITCSSNHTLGLRKNGTVVACGKNERGLTDVSSWENVVKILCGDYHSLGLRADGTVVACGEKEYYSSEKGDATKWTDIRDIVCTDCFTIGLKNDGTVVFAGQDSHGISAVSGWKDIVHIVCNQMAAFGLKKDGSVVTCGKGDFYDYSPVKKWKLFSNYETVEKDFSDNLEKRKTAQPKKKESSVPAAALYNVPRTLTYKGFGKELAWILSLAAIIVALALLIPKLNALLNETATYEEKAPEQPVQTTAAPSYPVAYVTASSGLNMRSGAGQEYALVTTVPYEGCVTVYEIVGEWARVSYGEYEGWCWNGYLDHRQMGG